jgi:hypothetical protein
MREQRAFFVAVVVCAAGIACDSAVAEGEDALRDEAADRADQGSEARDEGTGTPDDGPGADDGAAEDAGEGTEATGDEAGVRDDGGGREGDGREDRGDADAGPPCPPGWGDCNGNRADGCEADLSADPAHCGACGHDCLGGACTASRCQPVLIGTPVGASADLHNGFLALGPTHVYFSYWGPPSGGVAMAPKDGSGVTCIACDTGEPREIATQASWVFWADRGNRELRRAPLGGGSFRPLWTGTIGSAIAVDAIGVYWFDPGAGNVMGAELDGTSARAVSRGHGTVETIAAHSGFLFFISGSDLDALELSTGSLTTLARGLSQARSVAADASHVYWAIGPWTGTQSVERVLRAGGTVEHLVDAGAQALALDDTHVYVADGVGGTIWRMPKAGGPLEVLATGQPFPFDIAVDDVAVYWASETTAEVAKVAK